MDTDSAKWLKLRSGSDIRCREDLLTEEVCQRIGYAFACWLGQRLGMTPDRLTIAVGRDDRPSGVAIKAALIRGIVAADSDVIDGGLCAQPALFMQVSPMSASGKANGAAMVTSGDGPAAQNGIKFITSRGGLTEANVAEILRMASANPVPERLVTKADIMAGYRDYLVSQAARWLADDALKPLLGLYAVVATDTLGGVFFAGLLERLGADVERALEDELEAAVPRYGADMGFSFDDDSSRAWLWDNAGRPVEGNRMIALVAAMLLNDQPGLTIVTDSVTSTGLSAFIAEWGGVHYRFKRGYRNVIEEAIRLNAEGIDCPLAIETTGHAAFRENHFLDDGVYLALRIACRALDCKREGETVFDPLADLQEPVEVRTLRLRVTDEEEAAASCQEVVEQVLSHTLVNRQWQMASDSREGVRITFNLDGGVKNAWFQLRKSVHEPEMVLTAESDVVGGVSRMLGALYELIRNTDLLDLTPLRESCEQQKQM